MTDEMGKRVAIWFERIGQLLNRGVPIIKAVEAIAGEMESEDTDLLMTLSGLLRSGDTLTLGFKRFDFFPGDLLMRLQKGEESGNLDSVLISTARQLSENVFDIGKPKHVSVLKEAVETEYHDVLKKVNQLIIKAIQARASDLHLEPDDDGGRVRFRIDGVLKKQQYIFEAKVYRSVISRIKEMAALDIGEHRLPQDGRIKMRMIVKSDSDEKKNVDLRVSVCPFIDGEKVVIRFLDRTAFPHRIEDIRISNEKITTLKKWLASPHGMILVSGPTGSGKTTTLYLLLKELADREQINVMSIEDPVEYHLANVYQMQINPSLGLTFSAALRSVMRQDPDVVSVGEIQNPETAIVLAQTAQTGHLALSQLHARSAVGTIKLMYDLGVPAHILREVIIGVVSQRLIRRLCPHCKKAITDDERKQLPVQLTSFDGVIYKPVGCEFCHQTGYRGRDVVMELLEPRNEFWRCLGEDASEKTLMSVLHSDFKTLQDDGFERIREGVTGIAEIERVISN